MQNSYQAYETASGYTIPITNESVNRRIERITRQSMKGRFVRTRSGAGKRSISGDIATLGYPDALAMFLQATMFGRTQTLSSDTLYRHTYTVHSWDYTEYTALQPMTLEINRDGNQSTFCRDMAGQSLSIDIAPSEPVGLTMSVLGTDHKIDTAGTMEYSGEKPFFWDQCSISLDGSANLDFDSFNLSINNNLEAYYTLQAANIPHKIKRTSEVAIDITAEISYVDSAQYHAMYTAFENQTDIAFSLAMADGNNSFLVDIPAMRITGYESNIRDPANIRTAITAEANYSATSASAILIQVVSGKPLINTPFTLNDSYSGLLGYDYNVLTGG